MSVQAEVFSLEEAMAGTPGLAEQPFAAHRPVKRKRLRANTASAPSSRYKHPELRADFRPLHFSNLATRGKRRDLPAIRETIELLGSTVSPT